MSIPTLNGIDSINQLADSTMCAVLSALVAEGVITEEIGDKFLTEHVCVLVEYDGGFKAWLHRFFGKEAPSRMVVFKASINL